MKLTKKILAVLASAIMMAGSVSSVSAAGCPFDAYCASEVIHYKDYKFFDDSDKVNTVVKAKDGTELEEIWVKYDDGLFGDKCFISECPMVFKDERKITRRTMLQYSYGRTREMIWQDEADNEWIPYDCFAKYLPIEREIPNGQEGMVNGVVQVFDYKVGEPN